MHSDRRSKKRQPVEIKVSSSCRQQHDSSLNVSSDRQLISAAAKANRLALVLIWKSFTLNWWSCLRFNVHIKVGFAQLCSRESGFLRYLRWNQKKRASMSISRTSSVHPLTTHPAFLIPTITSSSSRDSDGSVLWQTALFVPDVTGHLSIKAWHLPLAQVADLCTNM